MVGREEPAEGGSGAAIKDGDTDDSALDCQSTENGKRELRFNVT